MGSAEKFLLHSEIAEELKAIPQVNVMQEGEEQANVVTRVQSRRKVAEVLIAIEEDYESEDSAWEDDNESDYQSINQSKYAFNKNTSDIIKVI